MEAMPLQILAVPDDPDILDLPWATPLEEWPADQLVALPRGISRHVVRFVRLNGRVYAIKEVGQRLAEREFGLLRQLDRLDVPAVEAVGIISGREDDDGQDLDPALITRHLQYSLPYRALFSGTLRPDTANRLLDALTVLLVRLHLDGFFWGDCSLSNTLFRRDAGAFAAYLVDAETGELHPSLSGGQRSHDLENARVNIFGELLDLEAAGFLHESIDAALVSEEVVLRYERLWNELLAPEYVTRDERYRLDRRIRRLNALGFDVDEVQVTTADGGAKFVLQPKVVDAGHHTRRLLRLTGLDVEENQARRLLNDMDAYRAAHDLEEQEDEEIAAHRWVAEVFEPTLARVPRELRRRLEPAELFHEVLEHRWFLSETAGYDVGLDAALDAYVRDVLSHRPDESAVLGKRLGTPSDMQSTGEMRIVMPEDESISP
jgi:Domain of unknown function (DUF4032)/Lipopolysaccharide kinase (Kdo/WaaP) family